VPKEQVHQVIVFLLLVIYFLVIYLQYAMIKCLFIVY